MTKVLKHAVFICLAIIGMGWQYLTDIKMKTPVIFSLISQFMLFKYFHFCNAFGINNPLFDLFICMFNVFGLKQVLS